MLNALGRDVILSTPGAGGGDQEQDRDRSCCEVPEAEGLAQAQEAGGPGSPGGAFLDEPRMVCVCVWGGAGGLPYKAVNGAQPGSLRPLPSTARPWASRLPNGGAVTCHLLARRAAGKIHRDGTHRCGRGGEPVALGRWGGRHLAATLVLPQGQPQASVGPALQ